MSGDKNDEPQKPTLAGPELTTEELLSQFGDDPLALPDEDDEDGLGVEISELDELREERDMLKDKLMRALADAENTRKRAERDRRDAELYGGTKLARDLLSVHDNMNRALEAIDDELREKADALITGIELTQKDLLAAFAKHSIAKVEPEFGEKFDPKLHQAMFEAPVPNAPAGTVIQVMNAGFTIGERLLRPAQVGVSSTPAAQVSAKPEADGAED